MALQSGKTSSTRPGVITHSCNPSTGGKEAHDYYTLKAALATGDPDSKKKVWGEGLEL